jgi:LCP family protein required for cell wall assembly
MDNFRPKKRPGRVASGSIDGFSSANRQPTKRFNRSYLKDRSSSDPSFDRTEGFLTNNQKQNASSFDENIPLENFKEPRPKKRLFRRNKKEQLVKRKRRFTLKRAMVSFLVLILLAGGGLGYVYFKVKNVFRGNAEGAVALQKNPDPARLKGEGDGRVNVLILGKGGPTQEDGPDLTDTILLASIDPVQNEAAILSLPRDLWVKDNGSATKINAVYAFAKERALNNNPKDKEAAEQAGTEAISNRVEAVLGVPIHYHVMVDFTAFQKAIDTVGGITIDVKQAVSEQMLLNGKPYFLNVGTGQQQFNGLRALGYARCRHCDARSDFGRSERQREILIALKDKILSSGTYSNPYKLQQLLATFSGNVRTDIGTDEIGRMYEIAKQISSDKIASVSLVDEPNVLLTTGIVGDQSVVYPKAGTFDYSQIQSYVRNNALKDAYLKNENAKILILNGTTTVGLVSKTATELKSYGYNVLSVGNAPTQDYVNNFVIDRTNGAMKYTLSYLERRMQVVGRTDLTDPNINPLDADFVIIIGKNEANRQAN